VADASPASDTTGPSPSDAGPVPEDGETSAPDVPEVPDYLAPVVDAAGPYRVGFRVMSTTYTPKAGEVALAPRTLRVAVWYPASDTKGPAAEYTLGIVRTMIHTGATPRGEAPMPVMVLSHGNFAFAESAYFIAEHFASHGWLVAAPDHTGNTVLDLGLAVTAATYLTHPKDVSATLDLLGTLPTDDPLAGRAGETVVVSGHSFGGYAAMAVAGARYDMATLEPACDAGSAEPFCNGLSLDLRLAFRAGLRDPRVDAIIPMAPGAFYVFGPAGPGAIPVPVLLVTGARDLQTPDASEGDPFWAALPLRSDVLRVAFPDAGHMTFSVTCIELGPIGEGDGCGGPPFIDPVEAHRVIDTYATAFVRAFLFDDADGKALLAGTPPVAPAGEALLIRR
jgi:predicted dienelactone hydrolase